MAALSPFESLLVPLRKTRVKAALDKKGKRKEESLRTGTAQWGSVGLKKASDLNNKIIKTIFAFFYEYSLPLTPHALVMTSSLKLAGRSKAPPAQIKLKGTKGV